MDVVCLRQKLKDGTLPVVREWATRLKSQPEELKKLLANEKMHVESVFLEETSEGNFLIYYMRADDVNRAYEISKMSNHPIDVYHRDVLSSAIASTKKLECLIDM
jgi:hypothetical protein